VNPWVAADDALLVACAGSATDPQRTAAVASATEILFELSGKQYGTRTHTIRPTGGCGVPNGVCVSYIAPFTMQNTAQLRLPGSPITAVTSVKSDGVVLDPSRYRVMDGSTLVRLDGLGWPCCQDLAIATSQIGTLEIVYSFGKPPTALAIDAARELACEFAKAKAGTACRLPSRTINVSRQGLSFSMPDLMEFLDKGRTGIYFVDLFLAAKNPGGISRRPTVASPDWPPRGGTP
jgi:hypothetical protein